MSINKIFTLLAIILIITGLSTCSDSSSDNNPPNTTIYNKYLPLKKGNWWKWQDYKLDSLGNPIYTGSTYDSTVIVKEDTLIAGKNASVYIYYGTNGAVNFIRNYCIYGSQIFMHSDGINQIFAKINQQSAITLPFSLPNQWIVLADFERSSWAVYDTTFKNYEIKNGVKVDFTFKIDGQKGTTKDITVEDKTYKSQEFKLVFSGEFNLSLLPAQKRTYQIFVHYWFGENAGKLLYTFDKASINFFDYYTLEVGGEESKVVKLFVQ
jgi:hypothetical protein